MSGSTRKWRARTRTGARSAADPDRRRAIERALAREGLVRGPRPLAGEPASGDEARRPWAARLAAVLAEHGPVFAAFGRYLAGRPDLLGTGARRALDEALPDRAEPAGEAAVAALLAAELGGGPEAIFAGFELVPERSGLLEQVHRALLPGGGEARVRLIRPGIAARLDGDLALLDALAPALEPVLPPALPFAELAAAFRDDLVDALDLEARAADLEALRSPGRPSDRSATPADGDLPAVPAVVARLSTARVLTSGALAAPSSASASKAEGPAAYGRARALHRAWLHLAFEGRSVVVAGGAVWLDGGRPGLDGGRVGLDGPRLAAREAGPFHDLGEYLRAVAAEEPERAFAALLPDLRTTAEALPEGELARRMRQAVPFGDTAVAGGDTVADHALLHWRLIAECGYRPSPRLEAFFRGVLWAVEAAGWRGDGARDPLRDAVDDLAWRSGWDDLRGMADPAAAWEVLGRHAATFATLPATLERAVDALERLDPERLSADRPSRRRERSGGATLAALGLVLGAVAFLAAEAAAAGAAWAVPVGALTCLTLGGLLVRLARRAP